MRRRQWTATLRLELERAFAAADRANNAIAPASMMADGPFKAIQPRARCSWPPAKQGSTAEPLDTLLPRIGEVPFSSERKLMSTIYRHTAQQDRGIRVFTKGAPDILLTRCSFELSGDGGASAHATSVAPRSCRVNEELAG